MTTPSATTMMRHELAHCFSLLQSADSSPHDIKGTLSIENGIYLVLPTDIIEPTTMTKFVIAGALAERAEQVVDSHRGCGAMELTARLILLYLLLGDDFLKTDGAEYDQPLIEALNPSPKVIVSSIESLAPILLILSELDNGLLETIIDMVDESPIEISLNTFAALIATDRDRAVLQ